MISPERRPNALLGKRLQIFLICIVSLLSYINIFGNGFVWDDYDLIVNNRTIQSWKTLPEIFSTSTLGYLDSYRPVRYVLTLASYTLFGLQPTGYHFLTLGIHLAVTILIYFIIKKLSTDPYLPFLTALFFGIHPVHTEAITWISSGMDMIGVMFLLASILYFLRAGNPKILSRSFSVLLALLAYFSLELTLILPALLTILIWYTQPHASAKKYLEVMPYIFGGLVYLYIRMYIIRVSHPFGYIDSSFLLTMLTMARAFLAYITVLMWPIHLTINHTLGNNIPSFMVEITSDFPRTLATIHSQRWTDLPVLATLGIFILCTIVAWLARKRHSLITMAIGWFFLTLLPVSNVIPTHAIMAERYLYLPSLGFCVLLAMLCIRLLRAPEKTVRYTGTLIIFLLVVSYMFLTLKRNSEWHSQLSLFTSAVQLNPTSYISSIKLGNEYLRNGQQKLALEQYEHILTFEPKHKLVITSLIRPYMELHNYQRALDFAESATRLFPNDANTWIKLGDVYTAMSRTNDAQHVYEIAKKIDPTLRSAK